MQELLARLDAATRLLERAHGASAAAVAPSYNLDDILKRLETCTAACEAALLSCDDSTAGDPSLEQRSRRRSLRRSQAMVFGTEEQLTKCLSDEGVDVSAWGSGSAKRVSDLLHEIQKKESELVKEDGRLIRCLRVAKLRIQRPDSTEYLRETKQIMPDGRVRARHDEKPGEKMEADEDPLEAAVRGIKEELADKFVAPSGIELQ